MRITILLLFTLIKISCFAQQAQSHLDRGIAKQEKQDYKGAIKDYNKAIAADDKLTAAYFSRGSCALALNDYKNAANDFNKTIELDPMYVSAYYSRASVFVNEEKYDAALADLDKVISMQPDFPNALTMRGQIRAQTGNAEGGCDDFAKAKAFGDKLADKYILIFCAAPEPQESFVLNWPADEKWKLGSNQENEHMRLIEVIHANETLEKWTEIGTMTTIKGARNIAMDKYMNLMFEQAKKNAPEATLTFIEKDETAEHPWIIFIIECPGFINDKTPESQLWFAIQGKTALYSNFRAVKKATLPQALKDKWIAFFKTGKITNN